MYRLVYDNLESKPKIWTGPYDVMLDKQNTLIGAFDYDPDCFDLTYIENN